MLQRNNSQKFSVQFWFSTFIKSLSHTLSQIQHFWSTLVFTWIGEIKKWKAREQKEIA